MGTQLFARLHSYPEYSPLHTSYPEMLGMSATSSAPGVHLGHLRAVGSMSELPVVAVVIVLGAYILLIQSVHSLVAH